MSNVLTCPVVDGRELEHVPKRSESGRPSSTGDYDIVIEYDEDDKYKWDYCTPAVTETLTDDGDDDLPQQKPDTLPAGGSGFNPGSSRSRIQSSLSGVYCDSKCAQMGYDSEYKCQVSGGHPSPFWCGPSDDLKRVQVSSKQKLWCIDDCTMSRFSGHYECK